VTIYGIGTKFDMKMFPYPTFQCTKFQGNQKRLPQTVTFIGHDSSQEFCMW